MGRNKNSMILFSIQNTNNTFYWLLDIACKEDWEKHTLDNTNTFIQYFEHSNNFPLYQVINSNHVFVHKSI